MARQPETRRFRKVRHLNPEKRPARSGGEKDTENIERENLRMTRRFRRPAVRTLSFFVFSLFLFGCVGIDDLSREEYRKGVLYTRSLANETFSVLPMTASGERRGYLPRAESIFFKALSEMRPSTALISPEENADKMKEENLDALFHQFQQEASFKKAPEESDLSQFKRALGSRFVLQTELQRVEVTEGATQVRLEGRLWDIELGDIIWEGVGESRGYLFLLFPRAPASFEKAMEVASRGMIRKLP